MNGFSQTLANLLSIASQLETMQPPSTPPTSSNGAPDFTSLGPALFSALGDIQNDASSIAAAAVGLTTLSTALPKLEALNTASGPTQALWTAYTKMTELGLGIAIIVAAQNLVASLNANNCVPTTQALSDFQQAYHAANAGVVVSGVYDNATAAAIGTTLGVAPPTCATPVNPVDPPVTTPPVTTPPGVTPATAAPTNNTAAYVFGGVAVVGLGLLAYRMMHDEKKPVH